MMSHLVDVWNFNIVLMNLRIKGKNDDDDVYP